MANTLNAYIAALERRARIAQRTAESFARITAAFEVEYKSAVGERDALAAYRARIEAGDRLAQAQASYEKQIAALGGSEPLTIEQVEQVVDARLAETLRCAGFTEG